MLGGKKNKLSASGSENVETIIGQKISIHGDMSFSSGLYIEGKIFGKVSAEAESCSLLTLAPNGVIEGELRATKAVISGRMIGDIYCSERIELTETAHIEGNIHYTVIEITAGATVSGQLIHSVPKI